MAKVKGPVFVKKANGSIAVIADGQIKTNLPAPQSYAPPTTSGIVPAAPGFLEVGVADASSYENMMSRLEDQRGLQRDTITGLLANLDDQIAIARALETDDVVLAGSVGAQDNPGWDEATEITPTEAIDFLRLEKAKAREINTGDRIAEDAKNGIHRLSEYGVGLLGSAEAIGTFETNSEAWLLARTEGIGGSDKIGYLDAENKFVPYKDNYLRHMVLSKTPEAVRKIRSDFRAMAEGTMAAENPGFPIQIGNALERTIQYEFAVNNPQYNHFEDKSSRVASGRPHHRFNPDGVLQDRETGAFGVFEAKTSRDAGAYERAIPGYKAQCLHNAAAADLSFAVLVADVEGESEQRVLRLDFSEQERADYREHLDRVWFLHMPEVRRRFGRHK